MAIDIATVQSTYRDTLSRHQIANQIGDRRGALVAAGQAAVLKAVLDTFVTEEPLYAISPETVLCDHDLFTEHGGEPPRFVETAQ